MKTSLSQVKTFISEDDYENAISVLNQILKPYPNLLDELALLSARFNGLNNKYHSGVITLSEFNVEHARIGEALLVLCKKIKKGQVINFYKTKTILFALLFGVSLLSSIFVIQYINNTEKEDIIPPIPLSNPSEYFPDSNQMKKKSALLLSSQIYNVFEFPRIFGFVKQAFNKKWLFTSKLEKNEPLSVLDDGIYSRENKELKYKLHVSNHSNKVFFLEKIAAYFRVRTLGRGFYELDEENVDFIIETPRDSGYYSYTLKPTLIPAKKDLPIYFKIVEKGGGNISRVSEFHFTFIFISNDGQKALLRTKSKNYK